MSSEDHDDEEGGYQSPEEVLSNEAHIYRIRFSAAKHVEARMRSRQLSYEATFLSMDFPVSLGLIKTINDTEKHGFSWSN